MRDLIEKMVKTTGRRIDLSTPFVDAMLPDRSRLHVVIPDITRQHWSVNIRKFVLSASSLDELVGLGTVTPQAARFLEAAVVAGLNVIVAGGTQAGKTTLLNCLASTIPARERVITWRRSSSWSNRRCPARGSGRERSMTRSPARAAAASMSTPADAPGAARRHRGVARRWSA